MRTTLDLICELHKEAPKFDLLLLAVAGEDSTTLVSANDQEALSKLNEAIARGGQPIGMLGVNSGDGMVTFSRKVFAGYQGEEWADELLKKLGDAAVAKMRNHKALD